MASLRRAALLGALALISVASTSLGAVATAAPARTASPLCQVADLLPTGSSSGLGYQCAAAGELLDLPIGEVRATQPSLGYDEVYYKLGRYTLGKDEINKKFDDWCEANGQEEAASALPDARLDNPSSFTCTVPVGQETPEGIAWHSSPDAPPPRAPAVPVVVALKSAHVPAAPQCAAIDDPGQSQHQQKNAAASVPVAGDRCRHLDGPRRRLSSRLQPQYVVGGVASHVVDHRHPPGP